MICPECGHGKSDVLDTRASGDGIRRRRQCQECGHRFTTFERIERRLPLIVKKDGRREMFDRDKIIAGLRLACRKRPVAAADLDEAADRVEQAVLSTGRSEVDAAEIGRLVLNELRDLDLVGYLRFASVYQEVESASEFLGLLQPFMAGSTRGDLKIVDPEDDG